MNRKPKYFIGIDNGTTGSIGIVDCNGDAVWFGKTPVKNTKNGKRLDWAKLESLLKEYSDAVCLIERPFTHPKRWKASISAARCDEAQRCVLERLGIRYDHLDSRTWQKVLGSTGGLKYASLELGNELYPQYKQHKHQDRDGLLIARHLWNTTSSSSTTRSHH